jgi:putative ABC transport system substrate-binding protein
MNRRKFITLLGGAAAGWPLAARGQQRGMPVVGYLSAITPEAANRVAPFRAGLSEVGYIESQNVAIEYRWAKNDDSRLPELAADLVRRQVAVIAVPGSAPAAHAAKNATSTIPIVFGFAGDPVQMGLVASVSRPNGNITGISSTAGELVAKRLELLHDLLPRAQRFAALINLNNPNTQSLINEARAVATSTGWQIEMVAAGSAREINAAFTSLAQQRPDALLVASDALFTSRRLQIATLATRHSIPAIAGGREYAAVGGLMTYGSNFTDIIRQVGVYTGRILKGAKPDDLPVLQPTKFELVINVQTAIALGIDVPPTLLARADEVIE